jgi:hypothetical protein
LVSAFDSAANAGKTVCVNASITGAAITVSTKFSSQARFVAQPKNMTVDMVPITFKGASRVTVEGFEMTAGGFATDCCSATTSVWMKGNYIHDLKVRDGLDVSAQTTMTDLQFVGNRVECLSGDGNGGGGYGIRTYTSGKMLQSPKFSYNTIVGCGNSGDGMEIGGMNNFELIGNEIRGICGPANQHADTLMIWAGSSNGLVKDNRLTGGSGTLQSPDGSDIRFENNLIANHRCATGSNQCVDATANGTSGSISPLRFTFVRNTIWDCGNGGINMNQATGSRGQNVADRNLVVSVQCQSSGVWSSQDSHNIVGGSSSCWPGGTDLANFKPTFADTINYLPLNLPAGYENVGYRVAPYGYTAAP